MNPELKKFLKSKKIIVPLPTTLRFKDKNGKIMNVKGTKGTYVVKWSDILKGDKH